MCKIAKVSVDITLLHLSHGISHAKNIERGHRHGSKLIRSASIDLHYSRWRAAIWVGRTNIVTFYRQRGGSRVPDREIKRGEKRHDTPHVVWIVNTRIHCVAIVLNSSHAGRPISELDFPIVKQYTRAQKYCN